METYVVNGVTLEYDTFDLEAMERRQKELEVVKEVCRQEEGGTYEKIRNVCNAMLDFFDAVIGPGTAVKVCGERVNVKTINDAYRDFNDQVNKRLAEYKSGFAQQDNTAQQHMNRAQRRAMLHSA